MTSVAAHVLGGALCVGFAAAGAARIPVLPAGIAAVALGSAPVRPRTRASGSRARGVLAAVGWAWGSIRLAALDRSVLAPQIGTAERALVEMQEVPRAGSYELRATRARAALARRARARAVLLELPLGRSPPQGARLSLLGSLQPPAPPSNGFDEANWLRRQGIHAVLRGQSWRLVGRRGGLAGIGDRFERWLAGDMPSG